MGCGWKTRGFPLEKPSGRPGLNWLGKMGAGCGAAVFHPEAPVWVREVPAVEILRQVWVQNYQWTEGQLAWRAADNLPPAARYISSPYDLDAHYSKKRTTSGVG